MKIAIAHGDGIGPEIMEAVLSIFKSAHVPLDYLPVEMGKIVFEKGYSTGMTPEAKQIIEKTGILFKGPMETPKGKGMKSINVTARKVWNTYANKRVFQSLHGVDTVFSKAGIPINLIIVRENIEDTYGGIEHLLTNDVALCRRFITRPGSLQVHRYAFEMAKREGRKKITCAHKANIMKLTDGLFLECFYEVAKEYPMIQANDIIVDDLAMKLVIKPHDFDVITLTNLQGDIISDLCAGLVGGLGFAPSANIGDHISIFEAVHGTAPDIAGKNIANPTSLLLSGIMLLKYLCLHKEAHQIENALLYTLEQGIHTGDFGDKSTKASSTTEFAQAIIKNLGKQPKQPAALSTSEDCFMPPTLLKKNKVMESPKAGEEKIMGVDLFFESNLQPNELADLILKKLDSRVTLTTITNRGTQVWPEGSIFTELVNQYRCRLEKKEGIHLTQQDILSISEKVGSQFTRLCSLELLMQYGEKKGFSLAQGQ